MQDLTTSRSREMQDFFRAWIKREQALEIRKLKEESWAEQVEAVNPDIDPYYDRPRLVERQPLQWTEQQREWFKHCREMDDDDFARNNGIIKTW